MLASDLARRLTLDEYALWVAYFMTDAEDRKRELDKAKAEAKSKGKAGRGRR